MSVDGRTLRHTVGQFVTGVTVVAMEIDGELRAMTANSFTSVSLDPPLVLVCVGKETKIGHGIGDVAGFSINILSEGQQDLSSYFAGAWKGDGPPVFHFVPWEGGPRLEGSAAALACTVHTLQDGGDHWIVLGRVLAVHRSAERELPLVFYAGRYLSIDGAMPPAAPRPAPTEPAL
jgi:flavin reductase (DIM6/NTAB) family NADH-FMN oxidoreductase RutF